MRSLICHVSLSLAMLCWFPTVANAQGAIPPQEIEKGMRESRPQHQRQMFDDLESASRFWYDSRNPANLPAMDEAIKKVMPYALELAPQVKDFTTWEEAQFMKPYHLAGSVLLAKVYTLLYYGRTAEAESAVKLIEEKLPFSMILYTNRTVDWVRENLRYHQHAIALYLAITQKKMQDFAFPPERDEFDGPQQLRAVEDQVILRLREGDYDPVNYFLTMARKQALRTTSGRWVENIIYDSMQPLESERHSTGAWNEMHEAILSWQRVFPKSEAAKIAEAGFLANHAYFQHWKQNSYSAYRQDIEKALAILAVYPTSSVGWYRLHTRVLISAGRPHEEIMISIRDSLARFPLHAQPLCDFCLMMARQGGDSAKTCADFIHLLCSYPNPEIPARVINMLHTKGLLDQVQSRIDRRDTDRILRAMAVDWKHSPSLRNELATLAVELGSRETASILLAGMQDQWSHALWKGKEDILKEVLAQAPPVEKALKLPAAQ